MSAPGPSFVSIVQTRSPNEEDGYACVVLSALQVEILRKRVQLSIDHGVSVQEIEEVHDLVGISQFQALSFGSFIGSERTQRIGYEVVRYEIRQCGCF